MGPAKTTSGSDLTISSGNQVISGGNTVSSSLDLALTDPYTLVPDHHQCSSASHGGVGTNICGPSSEENSGSNQNPDNNRSAVVAALKRTSSAETGSSTIPSTSVSGGIVSGLPVDSGPLPVQTISGNSGNPVSNNNHSLLCRTRSEDAASSSNEVSEAALTRSLPRI